MITDKIDFVISWVDGNDPKWQKDYFNYKNLKGDKRVSRFRDWDNLQYMFRSFEYFTPWVNKIYFITYGHTPKWLNLEHPKLVLVNHEDYIDKCGLPIFSSRPIEINFNHIKGLSEKFVYFNDDMFILAPVSPSVFFKKGLPVATALLNVMHDGDTAHMIMNNVRIINKHTKKRKFKIIFGNMFKWFYPGYGGKLFRTFLLLFWSRFTGFKIYHHPQGFLKSVYDEVWEKEEELLQKVSASRFRSCHDVNKYLFLYWHFITGKFYPDSSNRAFNKRKYKEVGSKDTAISVAKHIKNKKYEMYCINDALSDDNEEFEFCRDTINEALELILPKKSSFEL